MAKVWDKGRNIQKKKGLPHKSAHSADTIGNRLIAEVCMDYINAFLGRRTDLCACTDSYGKDKNDAGAYYGAARMSGCGSQLYGLV